VVFPEPKKPVNSVTGIASPFSVFMRNYIN
jgi:hypothetical protein